MENSPKFLPYNRQSIRDEDVAAVVQVLRGDWLTTGPKVGAFEEAFARRLGIRRAVACSSGTAALHLVALALDLGPGDAVIVPAITFLATANAARFTGADVIFSDVDPDTGLMCPDHLERILDGPGKRKAKAVFPVHFAGQTADIAGIEAVARKHGLFIVEDACHALGATYETATETGLPVGRCRHSDMAVFSMHPIKTITMGEGGMVTTDDERLADRVAAFRNHGIIADGSDFEDDELAFDADGTPNPWYHEMPEIGFNYRASDIHCALGLSQMEALEGFIARRRSLAARYDSLLEPLAPVVRSLRRRPDCSSAWHLYVVLIDFSAAGVSRATLMGRLKAEGIGTQVHYIPVHLQPYYRRLYGTADLPGAKRYYERCLSLPLFCDMAPDDVDRVVAALERALAA